MNPLKSLSARMGSLVLAVSAIPGPALHVSPFPILDPGASADAGASSAPAFPGGVVTSGGVLPTGDGAVPGGWTSADTGSALVRSAATFAVERLGEEFAGAYVVEELREAATQPVAGTNVWLRMRIARVRDEILGDRKDCDTVVYVPLGAHPQDQLASFTCQSVDGLVSAKVPM